MLVFALPNSFMTGDSPLNDEILTPDELRRRQLARLKGETITTVAASSPATTSTDFEVDDEHPPKRPVWNDDDWKRWYADRKQPENIVEPTPFIVGANTDEYGDRTAIPRPQWPSPSQPMTREIEAAHDREWDLWRKSSRALQYIIHCIRTQIYERDHWDAVNHNANMQQEYGETWAFLSGVWASRNITAPTNELELWADEYQQRYTWRHNAIQTGNEE